MADRTVRVVLTGNVAPYTTAMQQAARTTQTTARQIDTSTRQTAARSEAALGSVSRAAQQHAARTGAAFDQMATRSQVGMGRLGEQGAAAASRAGQAAHSAAGTFGSIGAAAAQSATTASSRWSSASTAISGAFSSARLAAYDMGSSVLYAANNGQKALKAVQAASLGLVAVFGLAAVAAARFEKAMSEVRAVTNGNASDMKGLSKAALDAGAATVYSATQAANAEAELARAGVSTADIIGGALRGSLDLAASGQLELGESAIISSQAMNAFKLTGRDVGHIADVISAGAGKSATNVHDMGMAFRQAALLASQTGLSLEDTVGTLSLFAQNVLTGSDA
ncbi:phage tail tape measure protein, partial [Streptomyces sp. NPDC127051]|uniref:phage tail tape measure protein n=1 Tax=Streptomyces sp. NPDC127051 TaxID=3347119 RepID=UPI0036699A74